MPTHKGNPLPPPAGLAAFEVTFLVGPNGRTTSSWDFTNKDSQPFPTCAGGYANCPHCLTPLQHRKAPDRPTTPGWKWARCSSCGYQGDRDHGA